MASSEYTSPEGVTYTKAPDGSYTFQDKFHPAITGLNLNQIDGGARDYFNPKSPLPDGGATPTYQGDTANNPLPKTDGSTSGGTPSPYYPRYTGNTSSPSAPSGTRQTYQGADGNYYYQGGGGPAPAPVKSASQIEDEMMQQASGEIQGLNDYYSARSAEQATINQKNDRSTSSISTLTGLAGSTEANQSQMRTTAEGQAANDKILAEKAAKIGELLGNIRASAVTEARNHRNDAITNESARAANAKAAKEEAVSHIQNLAAGGVTFDGLRTAAPQEYDYLLKQYGSEAALKGAFILNTPADQILDKKIENGKYIVATQNPITQKISVQTIDLGLPDGYSKTIDAGNRILAVPDNWDGDVSKLISIDKGLSPADQAKNGGTPAGYNGEFGATIKLASNVPGMSNAQRAQTQADLEEFIANGDYKSAYTQILSSTSAKLSGTAKTSFQNQQQSLTAVNDMAESLQALHDAGYDTNKLTGGMEKVGTKLGLLVTDPKYAAAATAAYTAFQQYRQNMTGAAFGAKESAEYASVLPNPSNTFELNLAKIAGAKRYLNGQVEGAIRNNIGQGGVEIKKYAEGATSQKAAPPTPDEMTELRQAFPDLSDQEIIDQATGGGGTTGFNTVGNTSASIQIPKGTLAYANNNPGNLRFAGQDGAREGKGGFAAFRTAAEGFNALVHQVQLDSSRGLTLAQFVSKYAPPTENNTRQYIAQLVASLGVSPSTKLKQIDAHSLAKAVAKKESSTHIA